MKKIKLTLGKIYIAGGKKYEKFDISTGKPKVYTVADALAKKLLGSKDTRDIPYFSLATSTKSDEDDDTGSDDTGSDNTGDTTGSDDTDTSSDAGTDVSVDV